MDSGSIGDCLKDIQICRSDNVENPIKVFPEILSPEIQDVFHIFVSMLDLKSFVKLAMTSKKMYKRCTEDKLVKISVHLDSLDVMRRRFSGTFKFSFANVPVRIHDDYVAAVRKFPCKISLDTLHVQDSSELDVHRYLNEIGVHEIHEFCFYKNAMDWKTVFAIIKDFSVRSVDIHCTINDDILRSILQLNLEKLTYRGRVLGDFILEIDSPIQEIYFPDERQISEEKLLNIMAKIQSGSLKRLTVDSAAVDWRNYDKLPFDYQGQLPYDRPLLLERNLNGQSFIREFWFLHWHEGITKLVTRFGYISTLEIFKCDPWECPWILRTDENVLMDLAEKRPKVSCSASHFRTFSSSFTMIDPSYKGTLPENRPLYFQVCENHFWLLEEGEKLMKCTWKEGCAKWEPFSLLSQKPIDHPMLAKYVFWKVLKQVDELHECSLHCNESIEFLKDLRTLDFDYSGPLPNERPLIFETSPESTYSERRVVLLEDRLLECNFKHNGVSIKLCHILKRPPILFTAKNVVEMLQYWHMNDVKLNVPFEMFRDGLELFKKSILVLQKRLLISEKTETEFWYMMDNVSIRKATWEKGRLSISEVHDIRESPLNFMEQVFRILAEAKFYSCSLKVDLEHIKSCLEQFTVVPFDYPGPLTADSSMAFVKSEIGLVHVWFLWNGMRLTKCSWGANGLKEVHFGISFPSIDVPPAVKSREYLKLLLQGKYNKSSQFSWFGDLNDFDTYLEDYVKLPLDYDGPLPKERPVCFDNRGNSCNHRFILREDGVIIYCEFSESCVCLSLPSLNNNVVPPALKSML